VFGDRSIQLFRVFGIRIGASPSWFIVLFLMIYWLSGYFRTVLTGSSNTVTFGIALAASLLFFVSLLLHELGHALVARRQGIGTSGIDLWLFGGVAKLTRDSQNPGEEFKVAAAGPAVTALIVVVCLGAATLVSHVGGVVDTATFKTVSTTPGVALLGWLALINLTLLVFNLIPAFPLDGGRIARSFAWKLTGDRNRATRISGRLGEGFGWLMIGLGIVIAVRGDVVSGLWFAFLGWFLGSAARGAIAGTRFSERLGGVTAGDLMDEQPVAIPAQVPAIDAHEEYFLRYRWPWFPVVDELGRFRGILREEAVDEVVRRGRPALPVGEVLDAATDGDTSVPRDTPVESMLGLESIRRLGAVMVVDIDGRLCGVVTADQLRRALAAAAQ